MEVFSRIIIIVYLIDDDLKIHEFAPKARCRPVQVFSLDILRKLRCDTKSL